MKRFLLMLPLLAVMTGCVVVPHHGGYRGHDDGDAYHHDAHHHHRGDRDRDNNRGGYDHNNY